MEKLNYIVVNNTKEGMYVIHRGTYESAYRFYQDSRDWGQDVSNFETFVSDTIVEETSDGNF